MHKAIRFILVLLCFFWFAVIRFRESELFYDPFIQFFKGDYQARSLPNIDLWKLFIGMSFRYSLHMLLSLGILWFAFFDKGILKFASLMYAVVFVLLIIVFQVVYAHAEPGNYLNLFYVRRFLIQPLLIFVLLPAFYYYRKVNS